MTWTFNPKRGTYYNRETSKTLGRADLERMRKTFKANILQLQSALVTDLIEGRISPVGWITAMRSLIKELHLIEYTIGRGGRAQMTFRDWGALGSTLRKQYGYLNKFGLDITEKGLSSAQIEARAAMYLEGAEMSFSRGKAASLGMPKLPAYPKDGSTVCLSNCRCRWEIEVGENGWEATWKAEDDPCDSCKAYAEQWSPLYIPFP